MFPDTNFQQKNLCSFLLVVLERVLQVSNCQRHESWYEAPEYFTDWNSYDTWLYGIWLPFNILNINLNRDVHHKWIEGGNYELCIEDVRDEIWDMVKPADELRITLSDLLSCKQGGTVASMLIDVRGFWAHDNRENLLQEEEEPEEEWHTSTMCKLPLY